MVIIYEPMGAVGTPYRSERPLRWDDGVRWDDGQRWDSAGPRTAYRPFPAPATPAVVP
jgi:hypothetical protein